MADAGLKETFNLFATDKGKKKVPAGDVDKIVRSHGLCPTEKQLQSAISNAGVSGEADFKQVTAIYAALEHTRSDSIAQSLSSALKTFDQDGAETVTVSDLTHLLTSLGEKMALDDVNEIIRQADIDSFGQITIPGFSEMVAEIIAK